ncbi:hypothetical protein ACGC1H_002240 [Rhizoctonia solani]
MFARPDCALPIEIYPLIFTYLDRRSPVQLSRVCRILFNATIRHIWQEVELRWLLALFPGPYCHNDVDEPLAPEATMSVEAYCARFALYAPHVKIVNMESPGPCTLSTDFILDRAENTTGQLTLPNLEAVNVHNLFDPMLRGQETYRQSCDLWMVWMIPPTLQKLSFIARIHRNPLLHNLIVAMCPQLTRFKFFSGHIPGWDLWGYISILPTLQELTSLEIRCAEISNAGYRWLSKLPKLQDLKLKVGDHCGQLPKPDSSLDYDFVAYPQAFSTLKSLHISVSNEKGLQYIMQIWRTIATHVTHITIETWNRICTLDMFDQLSSSLITDCPNTTFFHPREYMRSTVCDNALPLPISHLSALRKLPLRTLRVDRPLALEDGSGAMKSIGTLFPELEELWLNIPIKIEDLLQATKYLPYVRRSRLHLHAQKPTSQPLSANLGETRQTFDHGYRSDSNLAVVLHYGAESNERYEKYNAADWDFAAK